MLSTRPNNMVASKDSPLTRISRMFSIQKVSCRKRKKLLEAHYSDAIPLDLLKSEQQKIAKELAAIEHELEMHNMTFEQIRNKLKLTLDIVENCGEAYRNASDTIKD